MKRIKRYIFGVLLVVLAMLGIVIFSMNLNANRYISTFGPVDDGEAAAKVNTVIEKFVRENRFSGTVLVAKDGEIIFNEGYGYAKRYFGMSQNTPDTKFVLGSITKSFTAQAILSLADKDVLSLEDAVTEYYPDYPGWKGIKIHNLLNHTSGIRNYYGSPWSYVKYFLFSQTPEKIMSGFKNTPLDFETGKGYNYSNTNYITLSGIMEKVTGKSYAECMEENVFSPLGLDHTGYTPYPYEIDNMARGYCANMIVEVNGFNLSNFYGAGGLYSATEDVYKFLEAVDEERVLSAHASTNVIDEYYYGYGLMREDNKDYGKIFFHTGGGPGINTGMYKFTDRDIIIVILGNNMQCFTEEFAKELAAVVM